jgi:hypothetical protein
MKALNNQFTGIKNMKTFDQYLVEQDNIDENVNSHSIFKSMSKDKGSAIANRVIVKAFKSNDQMRKFMNSGDNATQWKETEQEGLKSGKYKVSMSKVDGKAKKEFVKVSESDEHEYVAESDMSHKLIREKFTGIKNMKTFDQFVAEQEALDLIEADKKKKLDPVGKADGDIDNDGDEDESDEYLAKRRKAISKNMKEKSCDDDMDEEYDDEDDDEMSEEMKKKKRMAEMKKKKMAEDDEDEDEDDEESMDEMKKKKMDEMKKKKNGSY